MVDCAPQPKHTPNKTTTSERHNHWPNTKGHIKSACGASRNCFDGGSLGHINERGSPLIIALVWQDLSLAQWGWFGSLCATLALLLCKRGRLSITAINVCSLRKRVHMLSGFFVVGNVHANIPLILCTKILIYVLTATPPPIFRLRAF